MCDDNQSNRDVLSKIHQVFPLLFFSAITELLTWKDWGCSLFWPFFSHIIPLERKPIWFLAGRAIGFSLHDCSCAAIAQLLSQLFLQVTYFSVNKDGFLSSLFLNEANRCRLWHLLAQMSILIFYIAIKLPNCT